MRDIRPIPTHGDLPKRAFDKRRPERPARGTPAEGEEGRETGAPARLERAPDRPEALDVCV
jgi:hypothetical protein